MEASLKVSSCTLRSGFERAPKLSYYRLVYNTYINIIIALILTSPFISRTDIETSPSAGAKFCLFLRI